MVVSLDEAAERRRPRTWQVAVEDGSTPQPKGPGNLLPPGSSVFDRIRRQLVATNSSGASSGPEGGEGSVLRTSLTYINVHFAFVAR